MDKLSIDDFQLKEKRVLVRVDYNVPFDEKGHISDDTRIVESLPTVKKILNDGGKAILMSHLGRPKGKPKSEFSLKPVAQHLSMLLNQRVDLAPDCVGEEVKKLVAQLRDGECLLLENLRFHKEEEENDSKFAEQLASLGDVYINDAFGTAHRAHASTEGVTRFIKQCAAGYLMQKEIEYLGRAVENPERPYVTILGGAKISGKIDVIQNLMNKVDTLIIGGGMAYTFFKAQGMEVGNSLVEADKLDLAKQILDEVKRRKLKFLLPVDCIIADKFDNAAQKQVVQVSEIKPGWWALDIGLQSIKLFADEIRRAKMVVWNGPLGVFEFENFAEGTNAIARSLVEATKNKTITIVCGGDSAAALSKIGLEKSVSHVSTGGGASLEFLEGKILPGIAALTNRS